MVALAGWFVAGYGDFATECSRYARASLNVRRPAMLPLAPRIEGREERHP